MSPAADDRAYEAVLRLEDKLTDYMVRAEEGNRETRALLAELSTRQAVLEDRQRRDAADLALAAEKASTAHARIDTIVTARAEDVGMRKGVVAGITLVSGLGGGGVVAAIVAAAGGLP